jgi:hypothetical protein
MKTKPSLDEFRNGGGEGPADTARGGAASAAAAAPATPERENKTIRIRKAYGGKLREEAYHRTMAENRRVTESDIIDEALEQYFALKR